MINVEKRTKILVCMWHPTPFGVVGGGWRIIEEVLKRTPENVEIHALDVKPSFLRTNVKIKVYEYSLPNFLKTIEENNFILSRILTWFLSALLMTIATIKLYEKEQFDSVYIPIAELSFTLAPAIALKIVFRKKIRRILSIFNIRKPEETLKVLYLNFTQQGYSTISSLLSAMLIMSTHKIVIVCANQFDRVITLSVFLSKILQALGIRRPMKIAPIGIHFQYLKAIPNQEKVYDAIFVGRHTTEKGVYDLIRAWEIVVRKYHNAKIILVGLSSNVARSTLLQEIKTRKLSKNVILHGPESNYRNLIQLIKRSRIFVFLSIAETWGIASIEGLACGLPVVAYDLPVYKENIKGCDAVFLVPISNYQMAAEKIIQLVSDDGYNFAKLSEEAITFSQKFDWDIRAKTFFHYLIN
jgi:glycosyltransferase involved in cell wall biosynthesis